MAEKKANSTIAAALADPDRLCPVLTTAVFVRGNRLQARFQNETVTVDAPASYLEKLFQWCDGSVTLAQLRERAQSQWGDEQFVHFVYALLEADILVDASAFLASAAHKADWPTNFGLPAPQRDWGLAVRPVSASLPSNYIALPAPEDVALMRLLRRRESAAEFATSSVDPTVLSTLLTSAYGVFPASNTGMPHRAVASACALYRLDISVILFKPVGTVTEGVYRVEFDSAGRLGLKRGSGEASRAVRSAFHPWRLRQAVGMIVISADLAPAVLRHQNRAHQFALLEAGEVIQNLALGVIDMGMGWRPLGGYDDQRLTEVVGLPGNDRILATGVFGVRADVDVPVDELEVDFAWFDGLDAPFELASARIATGDDVDEFSWGRASDPALAYDKSVAEATERHAYRQPYGMSQGMISEVEHAIDPRTLLSYRDSQYRRRDFPLKRFDPQRKYLWVKGEGVVDGQKVHVLADCVFHRSAFDAAYQADLYTFATSSGCASGITKENAVASATLELVERDAFMRHWFAQRGGRLVVHATLPDFARKRIAILGAEGCSVVVQCLDGVQPVYLVIIQHRSRHFTAVGAGCGLYPEAALESALGEAETAAYARLKNVRSRRVSPTKVRLPVEHADLYADKYYFDRADGLLLTSGDCTFSETAKQHFTDAKSVFGALDRAGHAPIVIDLSLPNAPRTLAGKRLFTVRVVAPGLIPIAFGYARLPLGMDKYRLDAAKFPHPFP